MSIKTKNKMRAIPLAVVCLLLSIKINAQIEFGIRAKAFVSTSSESSIELYNPKPLEIINLKYQSSNNGYGVGGFVYGSNDLLFFMTEIIFQKTESKYNLNSDINDFSKANYNRDFNHNKSELSIPVAAGIKFNDFKLGLGPVLNYTLKSANNLGDSNFLSIEDNKLSSGFQFIIGYQFAKIFHLDLKHEMQFSSVSQDFKYKNIPVEMSSNANTMSINLGVLF